MRRWHLRFTLDTVCVIRDGQDRTQQSPRASRSHRAPHRHGGERIDRAAARRRRTTETSSASGRRKAERDSSSGCLVRRSQLREHQVCSSSACRRSRVQMSSLRTATLCSTPLFEQYLIHTSTGRSSMTSQLGNSPSERQMPTTSSLTISPERMRSSRWTSRRSSFTARHSLSSASGFYGRVLWPAEAVAMVEATL